MPQRPGGGFGYEEKIQTVDGSPAAGRYAFTGGMYGQRKCRCRTGQRTGNVFRICCERTEPGEEYGALPGRGGIAAAGDHVSE